MSLPPPTDTPPAWLGGSERGQYLYGDCTLFAYALHRLTGLPVAAYTEPHPNHLEGIVHALCLKFPTDAHFLHRGDTQALDACGARTLKAIRREYEIPDHAPVKVFTDASQVLDYGFQSQGTAALDQLVAHAHDYIARREIL